MVPRVLALFVGLLGRIRMGRRSHGRQIALEQQRGRHTVDRAFALLSADVRGDQEILRRFRRHALIPQDERHG